MLNIISKLIKSPVSFSDSPEEKGIQRTFSYFSSLFWLFTTIVAVWCFAAGLTQAASNGYGSGISTFFAAISTCSALAAASSVLGGLFGFLFGIPKSNQNQENSNADTWKWRSGTNLEEISDWLTKILIGVGLAEATQLGGAFSDVLKFMMNEKVFPKDAGGEIIVPLIMVTYVVTGFLFSYLLTRMFLAPVLAQQDRQLNSLEVVSSEDDASQVIINYIWKDGKRTDDDGNPARPIPEHLQKMRRWMNNNYLEDQSIQKFLDSPVLKGARKAAINEIPIT